MVRGLLFLFSLCVLGGSIPDPAFSDDFFIYPNKGQNQEQMDKDKYECFQWAKQQTGFDPMAVPTASSPPPQQEAPKGGVGRGAFRGGAVGLAAGAIAGDAGKGAAIGAASGALIGGMRRRDQKRQQEKAQQEYAQQQANEYYQNRDSYNRAYGACLEGRGYTVK
jgi:outer membrane lipoprotein SlyB